MKRTPLKKVSEKKRKGFTLLQIPNWKQIRKHILERDNYACRICFRDGGEVVLQVHHINGNREDNEDSNLVTLCKGHHRKLHQSLYQPILGQTLPWGGIYEG